MIEIPYLQVSLYRNSHARKSQAIFLYRAPFTAVLQQHPMTRLLFIVLTGLLFACKAPAPSDPAVKDFFAQLDDSSFAKDNFLLVDSVQHEAWKNIFTSYASQD